LWTRTVLRIYLLALLGEKVQFSVHNGVYNVLESEEIGEDGSKRVNIEGRALIVLIPRVVLGNGLVVDVQVVVGMEVRLCGHDYDYYIVTIVLTRELAISISIHSRCRSEIDDLDVVLVVSQDVPLLEISMQYLLSIEKLNSLDDLKRSS
jgi:hypothetical protein